MERKTSENILLVALVLLVLGAAYLLRPISEEPPFVPAPPGNQGPSPTPSPGQKESPVPPQEEPAPAPEKPVGDLAWAVEAYKGKEISKVATKEKMIALTFDAGANADGVDRILSILAENKIRGTFFLTGKFIERYPDKARAILASGGDLGNHTYDHPYLTSLSPEQLKEEVQKTEGALGKLDGKFRPFLREPYGDRNASVLAEVSALGYLNVRWTVDSLGWKGTSGGLTKDAVKEKVLKSAGNGAIVLMHLGSNPDDKTQLDSEALPEIITELRAEGYGFTTLSQLLESSRPNP